MTMVGRRAVIAGLACLALPIPAQAQAGRRVALRGYDPVAYFTVGKPTPGKPEYESEFDGTLYRFASAENRDRFKADPERYSPQFAGACAGGVSMGMKVEADPNNFLIVDDKLFVFSGPIGDQSPEKVRQALSQAAQNWPALRDKSFQ
jgi:YHS domain-containing protein